MDAELKQVLTDFASGAGRITVLSGAGISAESGIPTFRGPEGYWTVGAVEYHPQEMATLGMFRRCAVPVGAATARCPSRPPWGARPGARS
ncbi:MAG TPA: Sir2 family NAD-dependent protein deacetylase [Desulfobacterales bacterium]|nr:Sir2 family NAD-dependent protein deacetylase [Desulfobacterales bacterium]